MTDNNFEKISREFIDFVIASKRFKPFTLHLTLSKENEEILERVAKLMNLTKKP